jgi:hypothetical protein
MCNNAVKKSLNLIFFVYFFLGFCILNRGEMEETSDFKEKSKSGEDNFSSTQTPSQDDSNPQPKPTDESDDKSQTEEESQGELSVTKTCK